jgi:MFS family permease
VPLIGFVSGALFALPLSISGIFAGVIVSSVNRKWMLCLGCIVWSAITFLQGYIDSFVAFCVLRSLMGVAMSVCNPLAYSLIRDYFPPSKRATANSLYSSAIYVGNALASLNIIFIKEYGWRNGYMAIGILGITLAFFGIIII